MLKQLFLIGLGLLLTANCIHLMQTHNAVILAAGSVNLRADNGQYLGACFQCGDGAADYSAGIQNYPQAWSLEIIGDKIAFKSKIGKYLARCSFCWKSGASNGNAAFVHIDTASADQPWALWTPELQSNGKYTFKADDGNYLARCGGCVIPGNDNFAFVSSSNAGDSVAQWDLSYVGQPKFNTKTDIIADNGNYLQICTICVLLDPNFSPAQISGNSVISDHSWIIEQVGNKVALKSRGKYLSRCRDCWADASDHDSAFANADNSNASYSQWTAVKQANGKWTFQADTGKYLARCLGCAYSQGQDGNFAFVHVTNPHDGAAQWTLSQ